MAGLRQGELAALRWQDIDWTAGVIRVRRTYTRGQFGDARARTVGIGIVLKHLDRVVVGVSGETGQFNAYGDRLIA